jgi:hypothetical protein
VSVGDRLRSRLHHFARERWLQSFCDQIGLEAGGNFRVKRRLKHFPLALCVHEIPPFRAGEAGWLLAFRTLPGQESGRG